MRSGGVGIVMVLLLACAGDDNGDDGGGTSADAAPGPSDASTIDGSIPDASVPDASVPDADCDAQDAALDAGSEGISIDDVTTSDGFTQVRQGASAELVITGSELGEVDTVTAGELETTFVSAAPGEVRVELFVPHGTEPGPRTVTVLGPAGAASAPDAVEITAYIVAADAAPGGRGTYQSPLTLCELQGASPLPGDTISLLAGEHVCDVGGADPLTLPNGVTVTGAGRGVSVVRGAATSFAGLRLSGVDPTGIPSVLRGFTVVAPAPVTGPVIEVFPETHLIVEDLAIEGPGFRLVGEFGTATVERLEVECDGFGVGFEAENPGAVTVTSSRFTRCAVGVGHVGGTMSISDSIVERCNVGIQSVPLNQTNDLDVTGCELTDNRTGIEVRGGTAEVTETSIRDNEVTPESSLTGILVRNAWVTVTGGEVIGQDQVGILAFASVFESSFRLDVTGAVIEGGLVGIDADGRDNPNFVVLRDSIVRDQTSAAVLIRVEGQFVRVDLGNGGGSGGNQLSVVSGIALHDIREDPHEFTRVIDATGILLNGRSYAGQLIEGPASQPPDYQILADGAIQF